MAPVGNNGSFVFGNGLSAFGSVSGKLKLKLKDNVEDGTYTISTTVTEAYNTMGDSVVAKAAADKVVVTSRIPGDVDNNGSVNGRDSMLLLQYIAGWDVKINMLNADVDGNGAVNGRDSMIMLQYIAGWPVVLK